jgi:hypothetical protein
LAHINPLVITGAAAAVGIGTTVVADHYLSGAGEIHSYQERHGHCHTGSDGKESCGYPFLLSRRVATSVVGGGLAAGALGIAYHAAKVLPTGTDMEARAKAFAGTLIHNKGALGCEAAIGGILVAAATMYGVVPLAKDLFHNSVDSRKGN